MAAPPDIDTGIANGIYRQAIVDYDIRGGVDSGGEFVQVPYYIPFAFRKDFEQGLLGTSKSPGGIGSWSINSPYARPDFPGLYAFATTWQPVGTITLGDVPSYSDVLMWVTFRTPMFNFTGGWADPFFLHSITDNPIENQALLWATQEMDYSVEYYTIDGLDQTWESDGVVVRNSRQIEVSITDLYITWHRIPYLPRGVMNFQNVINGVTFLDRDPGLVRLVGAKTEIKAWTDGTRTRTVRTHYRFQPWDWNTQPRVKEIASEKQVVWERVEPWKFQYEDFSSLLFGVGT